MRAVCIGHIVLRRDRTRDAPPTGGDCNAEGNALMSSSTVDNPFFARMWTVMSRARARVDPAAAAGEPRRPVRSGAGGRRGHGDELRVLSRHRDGGGRRRARAPAGRAGAAGGRCGAGAASPSAPTRSSSTGIATASRSTRWCARWCCARSMNPIVFCGNCFRCCGPAASFATSSTSPAAVRARGCRSSPTPRCGRGCWATATRIGTPSSASSAPGSKCRDARREWVMPAWVPMPVSEVAIGRAVKP